MPRDENAAMVEVAGEVRDTEAKPSELTGNRFIDNYWFIGESDRGGL